MEKITKESLFDFKTVAQPTNCYFRSYFTQTQINQKDNHYETELLSVDLESHEIRQWFGKTSTIQQIEVINHLRKLIFIASQSKADKPQIYTMPLDGGVAVALTDEKQGVQSYYHLPESDTVYYQTVADKEETPTKEEPEESKDEKIESTAQSKQEVEENKDWLHSRRITKLSYKNDGRGYKKTDIQPQIRKISINEQGSTTVLEGIEGMRLSYVAKDESYLLYNAPKDPENEWEFGSKVYRYDLKEKKSQPFFDQTIEGNYSFVSVNESEDLLVFFGNDFSYQFVTQTDIYTYDVKTAKLTNLTADVDVEIGDVFSSDIQFNAGGLGIEWLDNDRFIFATSEEGRNKLYEVNRQGDMKCILDIALHLTGMSLNVQKTQLTLTYSTIDQVSQVAFYDLETQTLQVVYNPNEVFENNHSVAEVESFWYKGYDDWDIQGWYVKPVTEAKSHPAILYIHGGPQVAYGESFFHEMQWLANEGYGVIMLNPRGGNSYGQDFVASILGDYGNHDYDDLMLGVDFVLNKYPEIDQNNLFVAGGSYGGFMTNWIVTHNDRFKAAVTQRSISNWISFYGVSDIGAFFVEFQLQNDLANWQRLWEMSPLAHAADAKTPILIIHSEEDLRCPQEQAEQFYIAMKKHDVPTEMLLFPKSNHGLSRNGTPNLRMERLQAIKDWFDQYQD